MTLKGELKKMEKFVAEMEKDEAFKLLREVYSLEVIAEYVIDKADRASKEYRAYELIKEEKLKKAENDSSNSTLNCLRNVARAEKYIVCEMIMYFAQKEPEQLMYCGNHFFVLKSLQFLVEMLDNSVIIHRYY